MASPSPPSQQQSNILTVDIEDSIRQLSEAAYGSHYLVRYSEIPVWRRIYSSTVKQFLEEDNNIVLVVPFYESTSQVRQVLLKEFADLEQYEKDGSLAIIDSIKAYFSQVGIMTFVDGLLKHAKSAGKNGISVFADMGSFFHMQKIHQLLEHEISLPARYDARLRGFCFYNEANFTKFTESQKRSLYEHHGMNLTLSLS
jgi:hypothetical protein